MMTRAPLSMSLNSRWLSLLVLLVGLAMATFAQATETDTQTKAKQLWQLLDYLAVDYGGAVRDGKVISASEYAEMQEFCLLYTSPSPRD